jgi:hypothetical protein
MNINDLVSKNKSIPEYREKCIKAYNDLLSIGMEIHKLEEVKWDELRVKGINDAVEFFKQSGLDVSVNENKYTFTQENTCIKYYYNGEDEMIMFQMEIQPNGIYDSIQIRHSSRYDSMLYWKYSNITLNGKHAYKENYIDVINSCDDVGQLETVYYKLNENIKNYENTLKNISDIEYVYSLYKQDMECNTFKELFEKHIG